MDGGARNSMSICLMILGLVALEVNEERKIASKMML